MQLLIVIHQIYLVDHSLKPLYDAEMNLSQTSMRLFAFGEIIPFRSLSGDVKEPLHVLHMINLPLDFVNLPRKLLDLVFGLD